MVVAKPTIHDLYKMTEEWNKPQELEMDPDCAAFLESLFPTPKPWYDDGMNEELAKIACDVKKG